MEKIDAARAAHEAAWRRELAEQAVRSIVMTDSIGEIDGLMERNVGARLAAQHFHLMTSVSPLALGAVWSKA